MEDYEETLADAILEAECYSTDANAIYGAEVTGVVTEKTFTPEQIAKYNLPKFMAWNTGTRAEYDTSDAASRRVTTRRTCIIKNN